MDENALNMQKQENDFAQKYKHCTDKELLQYLRNCANELGYCPKKSDVLGHVYLKQRLGPWPRILEQAGLKEKSRKNEEICLKVII